MLGDGVSLDAQVVVVFGVGMSQNPLVAAAGGGGGVSQDVKSDFSRSYLTSAIFKFK
jgi:hypothetical protein